MSTPLPPEPPTATSQHPTTTPLPQAPIQPMDNPKKGILAMILAVMVFAAMDAGMKQLSQHYSAMQVTCLRAAFAWPLIVLWLWHGNRLQYLAQARWGLHLFRAVLGIVMLASFVYSIKHLALADAYAIFFAAPFLITLLSVWWLKDQVSIKQWLAIAVGMLAVLWMLKPEGNQLLSLGALAALLAALCYAISAITVRILAKSDHSGNMVFWLMTMIMIGAGLLALPQWQPLLWQHWPWFVLIAITGTIGQILITEAFRLAPPAVIAPFEYTALVWGIGFDFLLWQHIPSHSLLLGSAVIIASGIYLVRQQRH